MGESVSEKPKKNSKRYRPPLTPEASENQMIALATEVAREQLINRTASSQVIVHYLKLGTVKAQQELEILKANTELAKAKTMSIQNSQDQDEMYAKAIEAMTTYKGVGGSYD